MRHDKYALKNARLLQVIATQELVIARKITLVVDYTKALQKAIRAKARAESDRMSARISLHELKRTRRIEASVGLTFAALGLLGIGFAVGRFL